jgi:hypothetical protein
MGYNFEPMIVIVCYIVVGLLVNCLFGIGTKRLMEIATTPTAKNKELYEELDKKLGSKWSTLIDDNKSGAYLGYLERLLFFGAFWANMPLVIATWLAFKVASKWNAWTNIIFFPKEISNIEEMDYLVARNRLGSKLYMRFVIGTLSNLIFGCLGVIVVRYTYPLFV